MDTDKFTNIYRLPTSIQIRIGKWQQTFRGTSDLVLHKALLVRNEKFKSRALIPTGWAVNLFASDEASITHHGRYIQTPMRSMIDRKVAYKRIYLSTIPLEEAEKALIAFKLEWIEKHNKIANKYNQIKLKEFLNFANEEEETLYPSIPKGEFDKALWNRLVRSEFGPEKKYNNPFFVKKAVILKPGEELPEEIEEEPKADKPQRRRQKSRSNSNAEANSQEKNHSQESKTGNRKPQNRRRKPQGQGNGNGNGNGNSEHKPRNHRQKSHANRSGHDGHRNRSDRNRQEGNGNRAEANGNRTDNKATSKQRQGASKNRRPRNNVNNRKARQE